VLATADRGEQWFYSSPFTSQRDADKRAVVALDEYATAVGGMTFI
jgi:hypothetical protein